MTVYTCTEYQFYSGTYILPHLALLAVPGREEWLLVLQSAAEQRPHLKTFAKTSTGHRLNGLRPEVQGSPPSKADLPAPF